MLRFRSIIHIVLACTVAAGISAGSALAQGYPPAEALARMKLPEGFQAQLYAFEPEIRQPVSMTFDDRGRMWVVQYIQYPHPAGLKAVSVDRYLRTVYDRRPEPPPKGPKGVDRITICEDTDGDGRADRFKDFLSDLNLATGMAIGHGGVFVVQSPYLLFYADQNRDDVPDGDPEVLLEGFGMEDSHAYANSLIWGPDGWLYGAQGSTVTATIRGITFQQGIWRYHPLTKEFELFSEGGGNTWGVDFDAHGQLLAGTNYGHKAMLHQMQGAYYVKNFGKHGELQNPYAFGFFEHVPYADFRGGHVTCGGMVYHGGAFPEEFTGHYVAANLLSNAIHWHHVSPTKSTFLNRFHSELMTTDDTWFRPVDCALGPDGAVYVADWCDERANHVDPADNWDRTNGRIYRITYRDRCAWPKGLDIAKCTNDELIRHLSNPNDWYRRAARVELAARRDASIVPKLQAFVRSSNDPQPVLNHLWAAYVSGGFDLDFAKAVLAHHLPEVRGWGVRLLGDTKRIDAAVWPQILEMAKSDTGWIVRAQLACTCKRLPAKQALALIPHLAARDADLEDPFIPLLVWWAVEAQAIESRDKLLAWLADPAAWKPLVARDVVIPRLARRYAATGDEAGYDACAKLLAAAPSTELRMKLIEGIELGMQGRQLESVPQPLEKPLAELLAEGKPSPLLLRCAVRLGSRTAFELVLARLALQLEPEADRLALVDVAAQSGDDAALQTLLFVTERATGKSLRKATLTALARFNNPRVASTLLSLYPKLPADLQAAAIGVLASRLESSRELIAAVDGGTIDVKAIGLDQLQRMALFKDRELAEAIEKRWGKIGPQDTGAKLARMHGINVSLKLAVGKATAGKPIFAKHCGTCHTIFGEGNKIGPDLTGAERKNRQFWLQNIVDPSAVIRKEFMSYQAELIDGRVLTGLLVDATPTAVTLLDAKNQRTQLSRDEIESLEPAPLSLMPEKILDQLTEQEVRDLFAFLESEAPPPAPTTSAGR